MKQDLLVTIIVLTYKDFSGLNKTVEAILEQTYQNIEIIISDDGSENYQEDMFLPFQKKAEAENKKIILKIDRKNKIIKIKITPKVQIENGKKVGMIGVMAKVHYDKAIVAILSYGFTQTWYIITSIIGVLGKMFTQGFSLNDLGGPVAMYSYTSEAAHYGILSIIANTCVRWWKIAIKYSRSNQKKAFGSRKRGYNYFGRIWFFNDFNDFSNLE